MMVDSVMVNMDDGSSSFSMVGDQSALDLVQLARSHDSLGDVEMVVPVRDKSTIVIRNLEKNRMKMAVYLYSVHTLTYNRRHPTVPELLHPLRSQCSMVFAHCLW